MIVRNYLVFFAGDVDRQRSPKALQGRLNELLAPEATAARITDDFSAIQAAPCLGLELTGADGQQAALLARLAEAGLRIVPADQLMRALRRPDTDPQGKENDDALDG